MKTLSELSSKFFEKKINKNEGDIGCLKRALYKFCDTGKKEDAFSVYFCFCEIFEIFGKGYDTMSKLLEFLSDHEYHSGELLRKHRDHYSHSVYVFALGLSIYANDDTYKNKFVNLYKTQDFGDTDFLYLWGLTALFHDIGYPFQLAHEQIKSYSEELWGKNKENNPYVSFENMENLLLLNEKTKKEVSFVMINTKDELLAYGINFRLGYPLHILLKLLKNRYANRDFMDHAYFSAILLTYRLTQSDVKLTMPILDVLTAIALHNSLNKFDIKYNLKTSTAISPEKHPLAYLLILCDELQNWDRRAFGYISKKDPLAWTVDLDISENKIRIDYYFDKFTVIDTDPEYKDKNDVNAPEIERLNGNVEVLQTKKFQNDIYELIKSQITIEANAVEKKKNKQINLFASSDKFVNLCDFAKAIHKSYQNLFGGMDFEELPLEFKLSNIEQAKSYSDKLELINCFYSDKELDYPIVKEFTKTEESKFSKGQRDHLGFLAREEHLRWVREKLDAGWKYGTDYKTTEERNTKKIHKDIVPYDCLPEIERAKDELMIKNMVPLLYKLGHGVRIYSYRTGLKPVLNIAGCGHRSISMKNEKIKEEIKKILREYQNEYRVVVRTNFAFGADQLISQCANELGITIKAAIPYEREEYIRLIREDSIRIGYKFDEEDEMNMRHLMAQVVSLKVITDPETGYLEATKYILNKSEKLIALWDGMETILKDKNGKPINQGGTWHAIWLAKNSRRMNDEDIHIVKCER